MAATAKVYCANGAGPTHTSVSIDDAATFKFGLDDAVVSTTTMAVPIVTGTNFSARKYLELYVTAGGGATTLSNLNIKLASALAAGLHIWWMAVTTYVQNTLTTGTAAGNFPAAGGTNHATPANPADGTYAELTTSNAVYDATGGAAVNGARSGKLVPLVLAVDNLYTGGGGTAVLPNITITYDEA